MQEAQVSPAAAQPQLPERRLAAAPERLTSSDNGDVAAPAAAAPRSASDERPPRETAGTAAGGEAAPSAAASSTADLPPKTPTRPSRNGARGSAPEREPADLAAYIMGREREAGASAREDAAGTYLASFRIYLYVCTLTIRAGQGIGHAVCLVGSWIVSPPRWFCLY